jgi:asparagine synthase (glutamine-hydrolysing)
MPGICVLAHQTIPADTSAALAEMLDRMRHHPWYQEDRFCDPAMGLGLGRLSLGVVNAADQPAFNEDRSLLAVMAGELLDADEQRRDLTAAGHRFEGASHAEVLLHGYESGGPGFFARLHGTFAAASWDVRARRLFLTNDRFGMKPLYYARLPGRLLAASEIKALLAEPEVSRGADERGIAQFFTFGHLLGEDTLLEGVRLLPAAGWLTYDAARDWLTLERYCRFGAGPAPVATRAPEWLGRVDEAFGRAVGRHVGGDAEAGTLPLRGPRFADDPGGHPP